MIRPRSDARDWLTLRSWQRHSLVLTVAGLIYIACGLVYCFTDITAARAQSLWLPLLLMPLPAWGAVWAVVGACAVVSGRWPAFQDTWGYTALTTLSVAWASFHVFSGLRGYAPAWLGVCVWALMAFIWWAISGLRNPVPAPHEWSERRP